MGNGALEMNDKFTYLAISNKNKALEVKQHNYCKVLFLTLMLCLEAISNFGPVAQVILQS